jgi:hypothetical protein
VRCCSFARALTTEGQGKASSFDRDRSVLLAFRAQAGHTVRILNRTPPCCRNVLTKLQNWPHRVASEGLSKEAPGPATVAIRRAG